MRGKDISNFLKAGIVIALILAFIIPGSMVFAHIPICDDAGNAFLADNVMWVQNETGMPGETKHVYVGGTWDIVMRSYVMVMHYDSSKIDIVDVSLKDTIAVAIPDWELHWWDHDDVTPSYIQSVVTVWSIDIPPGSGNLWNITVQIAEDAPEGDTVLDLFNDYTHQPVLQCTFVDIDSVTVDPELHDGILTIVNVTCGDVNGDSTVDVGDVVHLVNYLFKGGAEPVPIACVGDTNSDNIVDVADVVYLINYLFRGGSAPEGCCSLQLVKNK